MNAGDALSPARLSAMLHLVNEDLDVLSYYNLLGTPREANEDALRQAYHSRALMLHPDRYLQVPDAELRSRVNAIYKRIAEAYRVLSNPATRADYDRLLARGALRYSMEAVEALGAAGGGVAQHGAQPTSRPAAQHGAQHGAQPTASPSRHGAAPPAPLKSPPASSPVPTNRTGANRIQSRQAQELYSLATDFSRRMEFGKAVPLLEQALSVEPSSTKLREALDEALRLRKLYGG